MSKAWMPFYGGDFLGNTLHLSTAQIGAYVLILWHCWEHEGCVPADDQLLARIARVHPPHWPRYYKKALTPLLSLSFDRHSYVSKRIVEELAKTSEISNKRKHAAEQMLKRKRANAEQMLPQSQSQSQSHTQEAKASCGRANARGTRLAKDWWPTEANIQYALSHGLSLEHVSVEGEKFRNYWTAKTGQSATKLDWDATWQNWILKAAEQNGAAHGNDRRRGESLGDLGRRLAAEARELERAADNRRSDDPFGKH